MAQRPSLHENGEGYENKIAAELARDWPRDTTEHGARDSLVANGRVRLL